MTDRVDVDVDAVYKQQQQRLAENNRGHHWVTDENGLPDLLALDVGYHNGPRCEACDYSFCHHCQDGPDEDCPNVIDVAVHREQPALING